MQPQAVALSVVRSSRAIPSPCLLTQGGHELTDFEQDLRLVGKEDVVIGSRQFDDSSGRHIASNAVDGTPRKGGISGISMGGYGALKIAMKHPEMFGSVSAHSAALVPDFNSTTVTGRRLDQFKSLFDSIFGIGFAGGGPLDLTYWNANNPLELAKDTAKFQGMKIYVDCGTEDEYGFYAGQQVLDDLLTKAKYPHTAALHPGVHGWDYAKQHTQQSLLFHWNAFNGK